MLWKNKSDERSAANILDPDTAEHIKRACESLDSPCQSCFDSISGTWTGQVVLMLIKVY